MIPSSSSSLSAPTSTHRPPSSLSQRPLSSLSHRPPSSASQRPPSSASHRPPSSLSSRPMSSTSMRPHSRVSQRPHSRHARSRLLPLCQTLVTQVTGLRDGGGGDGEEGDGENFRTAVDFVVKNLEATTLNKGAPGVDMGVMDRQIRGCVTSHNAHFPSNKLLGFRVSPVRQARAKSANQLTRYARRSP